MLKFFSLTFALSWTCFIVGCALTGVRQLVLLYIGTFAPAIVALGLTAWDDRTPGIEAIGRRVFEGPSAAKWYVFAVSYMGAIKLTAAVVYHVTMGEWPAFGSTPWYEIAGAMVISTPVQAGEEIGWRGYALPGLAARWGFGPASLVLGVIWGVWHLPLFFIPGLSNYGQSFPVFVMGVTALSVAIAWLYARTNGNLLITMLMHSAFNQTVGIVPSAEPVPGNPWALSRSPVAWISLALVWMTAAYFLAHIPKVDSRAAG